MLVELRNDDALFFGSITGLLYLPLNEGSAFEGGLSSTVSMVSTLIDGCADFLVENAASGKSACAGGGGGR